MKFEHHRGPVINMQMPDLVVQDDWKDAEEGERGRAGYTGPGAGQRHDHGGARLRLPPCIHNGTAPLAHRLQAIPDTEASTPGGLHLQRC